MNPKALAAILPLVLVCSAAAEENEGKPRRAPTPLKLQVVLSRYQGDKKIGSLPYTLAFSSDSRGTRLRMELQGVGTKMDCLAESLDDGRYRIPCTIEQSSVHAEAEHGPMVGAPPVLRNFSSAGEVILRDGQTGQYVAATDPVTGEVVKVDMTLTVVK